MLYTFCKGERKKHEAGVTNTHTEDRRQRARVRKRKSERGEHLTDSCSCMFEKSTLWRQLSKLKVKLKRG